jgi:metal-dependent amidase/aminoacylase/carboxypeptidase family protein
MDNIEERILRKIDENREEIITFARDIYTHAELGFKEFRTAGKFENGTEGDGGK